ncbi:MAG: hypothetical protein JG776_154 [Caloramator sp.]|jgi:Cdc6-like AAA superfamily ATPase|uniref:PRK06851 family protein n=1 Tax=Caloramator sp. TaxID=1871330 RepID=UPI001DD4686B|nr:PRK06851 family protein [Caloramator sp.]MBZ4662472.1 hypothetical protein [Caloramator sp.]
MGKKYFASANTSSGFVSYFDYVLKGRDKIYIIKGGPGCGKSSFMHKIGNELELKGFDVDYVYCSADMDSLDGIVINDLNIAIVDGTAPHVIDPKYPGAVERILNFGDYWDIDLIRKYKKPIIYYTDKISEQYSIFFSLLREAKLIHDEWEKEYLKGMDFEKADKITQEIINGLNLTSLDRKGEEVHRFAGAMTPQGQQCFYEDLIQGLKNRIIVKGRPGTGKSTMTKKVARAAIEAGLDVEFYHCAFDPSSIDMIIIPARSFVMLDGTVPHVYNPNENDKVVDMFECIDQNIVKENEDPIKTIEVRYRDKINEAKEVYSLIKNLHDELEKYYIQATDFSEVDALRRRLVDYFITLK